MFTTNFLWNSRMKQLAITQRCLNLALPEGFHRKRITCPTIDLRWQRAETLAGAWKVSH